MKQSPLKIDLHVHTCYSEDATITPKEVIYFAKKTGLNGVAITDHHTLKGALKLAKTRQILIIPGTEVETQRGHVLALGVTTPIPPNLSMAETLQRIHDTEGIAVLAHPAAVFKTGLGQMINPSVGLDAVEVINSASFPFSLSTHLSRRLAKRLSLPQTAGSDAHHASEIGTAYTLVEADSNADDVIEAIRKGAITPYGKPIAWTRRIGRGVFYVMNVKKRLYSSKFSS